MVLSLDEEIYQNCDSNVVYSELDKLLIGRRSCSKLLARQSETALYLYGKSYVEMRADSLANFLYVKNVELNLHNI